MGAFIRRALRLIIPTIAVLATSAGLFFTAFPYSTTRTIAPSEMAPYAGFAYIVAANLSRRIVLTFPRDSGDTPGASNLKLREDGRILGPAHTVTADIQQHGAGRYSHWEAWLVFSTSDNSDPRTNGRRYEISAAAQVAPVGWLVIAILDLLAILWFRADLARFAVAHRKRLGLAALLITIAFALGVATGALGLVNRAQYGTTDFALVRNVVFHVVLACAVTLLQWTLGAGLARALLPRSARVAEVALAGFPLSLLLLMLLAFVTIAVPYGGILAIVLAVICLIPLGRWPLDRGELRRLLAALPTLLVISLCFGSWLSLTWHGPTANLPGFPLGDHAFYGSSVWALGSHPVGRPNLAIEGEAYGYSNTLLPAIGAALQRVLPLDGLLLMSSTGAISLLSVGIALRAYLADRTDGETPPLGLVVLTLAVIGAAWFPTWLVSSPQVAFTAPLTISIWFWSTRARVSDGAAIANAIAALLGSALTKVVTAATLVPLAMAPLLPRVFRLPPIYRLGLAVFVGAGAVYAGVLVYSYGALFWRTMALGPDSYAAFVRGNERLWTAWPYLWRDVGSLAVAIAVFRLADPLRGLAVLLGVAVFLANPFWLRANFICAVIAFGLAAIDAPERLARNRVLALAAGVLIVPAAILKDPGGMAIGIAWAAALAALVYGVSTFKDAPVGGSIYRSWHLPATAVLVALAMLVSASLGRLPVPRGDGEIGPDAYTVWRATRDQTPAGVLVFTDQTGPEPRLLEGWNTYAQHGQRQVFIAGWYGDPRLRTDAALRAQRLAINDDVLSGRMSPADVVTSRPYGQFAAVVSARRQMPPAWRQVYANGSYALYLWAPSGS